MFKKLLVGVLVAAMTITPTTVFAEEQGEGAFDPRSITEGVTLTIAVKNNAQVADYNTNKTTLELEEALGVDLQFEVYGSEDYEQKLNAMVASGEKLPDIFFGCSSSSIQAWAQEGVLVDMREWFENEDYAANIYKGSEIIGYDILTQCKDADGHMYFFPYFFQATTIEYFYRMWMYEPWLEQLGVEKPSTTEEFYELAKMVAETDLNGNGKADEYVIGGDKMESTGRWFKFLMNPFVYAMGDEYLVSDNGELRFAYMTDEWKEGLKYIKRFFDEGLIPVDILTRDADQWNTIKYDTETIQMLSIVDSDMYTPDPTYDALWKCIPALEGPDGLCQAYYRPVSPSADNQTCVTTDCENPLAAFLVLDYLCDTATSITCRYGEQGVNWDFIQDTDLDISAYEPAYSFMDGLSDMTIVRYEDALIGDGAQNASYQMTGPAVIPAVVWNFALETDPADEAKIKEKARYANLSEGVILAQEVAREEVVYFLPMTGEEQGEIIDPKADVTKYVNESIGAFLTGTKDIDADWADYLSTLESLGADVLLENYQAAWDRVEK